jgi:tetratricopeptide (TPR) repeat protein
MRRIVLILVCFFLTACATAPLPPIKAGDIFQDQLFTPPAQAIHAEDALAISEPMRDFAMFKLGSNMGHVDSKDRRMELVDALYHKGGLMLEYYSDQTRTAAEAFDAKSGNCLSLVLLTAAFAKELRLPYHYQVVVGATDWSQSDNFFMAIGHVNIVLDELAPEFERRTWNANAIIIDFLTPEKAAMLKTEEVEENTVLAMYLNNRAVENLMQGKVNVAYWWAKAALQEDTRFYNAYLTLAIIYRTVHHPELAEMVLEKVAEYDQNDANLLTDQELVLKDLGRDAEAKDVAQRLAILEQDKPWSLYFRAQTEFNAGHYDNAKRLYQQEIKRDPEHHEFEYGLALTYLKLKDTQNAVIHLERAIELCTTTHPRDLYQLELDRIKSAGSL